MYGLAEYEGLRRAHEEIRREAAVERPSRMAREDLETEPYVVRDLSWELARYLDTQSFPASASAAQSGAGRSEMR